MRYIITLLILMTHLSGHTLERDKKKHIAATTIISSLTYITSRDSGHTKMRSMFYALVAANVVGIMKEATDERVDRGDLAANFVGSVLGITLCWSF